MYLGLIIIGSGFRFVHLDMRETIIMIYQWGLVHIHPFEEQVLVNGFVCLVRTQTVAHRMANPPKKKKNVRSSDVLYLGFVQTHIFPPN